MACSFCRTPKTEFAFDDVALCYACADRVYRAFRRNKRFREATEHGVVGVGSKEATFLRDIERRRA